MIKPLIMLFCYGYTLSLRLKPQAIFCFACSIFNIARGFNHGRRIDVDQHFEMYIVVDIRCVLRLKPQAIFCFCVWYFN